MRNRHVKFVPGFPHFLLSLLFVLAAGIPLHAQSDAGYGISEAKNVMIAMRDGVKLAADIYRPASSR
jgi:predicted acyl esterase